jgi:predicted MFS family arabinose efflux permease
MTIQPHNGPRLRVQLLAAVFARVVVNTAHRMPYAFLPVFSRGLGVSDEALIRLLSARGALGLASPLFGSIPDRLGRRRAMLLGLAIFCGGLLLVAAFPVYPAFFVAILCVLICKFIFDPALQAYLGDRVAYARRGLVIAISEFGWSGAVLVGMPLLGYLIRFGDWRSPFLPLAGLGVVGGAGLWFFIGRDTGAAWPAAGNGEEKRTFHWLKLLRRSTVVATLSIGLVISAANDVFGAVYARWLNDSFNFTEAELGLTAIVIGVAELLGEGLVALFVDRVGKRRAVVAGLAASAVAYGVLCLPAVTADLRLALAAIFFVFITFEFAIVASLPLVSELAPEARSTVFGLSGASHAAGRMIGPLIASWAYRQGFAWNGAIAALLNLLWIPVILWLVKERAH